MWQGNGRVTTAGPRRRFAGEVARRQMALLFVRHEIPVELIDKHVISRDKNRAEPAMNYAATLSEEIHEVVSVVNLRPENERWLIRGESMVSKTVKRPRHPASSGCGPGGCPPGPCFGGRCEVPGIQPAFPPGNKPAFQIVPCEHRVVGLCCSTIGPLGR